jgi:hypothetical protein
MDSLESATRMSVASPARTAGSRRPRCKLVGELPALATLGRVAAIALAREVLMGCRGGLGKGEDRPGSVQDR